MFKVKVIIFIPVAYNKIGMSKIKVLSSLASSIKSFLALYVNLLLVSGVVITKCKIQNIFLSPFLGNLCFFATRLLLLFAKVSLYFMLEN